MYAHGFRMRRAEYDEEDNRILREIQLLWVSVDFDAINPATRWGDCLVGKSGCKIPGPHQHGVEDRRKQ